MRWTPRLMRLALNWFGPYLGAAVQVTHIDGQWHSLRVRMRQRWYNTNAVGTHFGGSLYAMVDPHLMLLLMQRLGPDFVVWDRAATIEFVRPGRGTVEAHIEIPEAVVEDIRERTRTGEKYLPEFNLEIRDQAGELVAQVFKRLYVRRKDRTPPPTSHAGDQ